MKFPLSYDATITRSDFVRLLPRATNEARIVEEGDVFRGAGWSVRLTPLPQLVIGLFRLDRFHVEHAFDGYSDDQQDRFMRHFTTCYQRGGG